jgi:DNA-binding transcriptional LysR family regulator
MHEVNLASIDLNLLVALDALLEERHVTRAARRLGLSQPAASHALARLRELLRDPLLVRSGATLVPTPRASALVRDVRAILDSIRATLAGGVFDPATSTRHFALGAADYFELVVLPALVHALAVAAPGIDLVVRPVGGDAAPALGDGKLDVFFAVDALAGAAHIRRRPLFDEGYVCAVRAGHPVLRRGLDLDRFLQLGHVFIAPGGTRGGVVDDALARRKKVRRVVAMVPSFLAAPAIVASSDLIVTMPVRPAKRLASAFDLRLLEPPIALPRFTVSAYWHDRVQEDPAHVWLREQLVAVSRTIDRRAPGPA